MRVAGERPQRKQDESGKDDEDGDTAGVVDPLAKLQAAVSSEGDAGKHEDDDGQAEQAILWQAARSRADEVGNLRWDGVEDGGGDGDAIDPEVPRSEETAEIAEGRTGPDVESPFEGHGAVEADDRCSHGYIKEQHGRNPDERLCPAESAGDAHPRGADDAEDLGEDQIAQAERAVQAMLGLGALGHGSAIVQGAGDGVQVTGYGLQRRGPGLLRAGANPAAGGERPDRCATPRPSGSGGRAGRLALRRGR